MFSVFSSTMFSALGDPGDGLVAQLAICNKTAPDQAWVLRASWGDNNTLVNTAINGFSDAPLCLDIGGWDVDKRGSGVQAWHCCCRDHDLCPGTHRFPDKNYNEQWGYDASTGWLRVFHANRTAGLCLEAREAQAGAALQLWPCDPTRKLVQTWVLAPGGDAGPLLRLQAHDDDGDNWCLATPSAVAPTPAPAPPASAPCANAPLGSFPWCDPARTFEARAAALAAALSPAEQVEQISTFSFTSNHSGTVPGVARLRLPPYNYHSEGLHGVRDSCDGAATLWPQVVGMAATGNLSLIREMGAAMGAGFRASANVLAAKGAGAKMPVKGCSLSVYGPTMNIVRDPRWGRNQETVSEDPFLNGAYAAALVRGAQGDDPRFLQIAYTCKHLAAYSVEADRMHGSDAVVSERDLQETYLPAFKSCVLAGSQQLMCRYASATTSDCFLLPLLLLATHCHFSACHRSCAATTPSPRRPPTALPRRRAPASAATSRMT